MASVISITFRGKRPGATVALVEMSRAELEGWQALLGVMTHIPALLDAQLKTNDISHHEFQVLWCLSFRPDGTKSMGDLASTAHVTPSHLSRIAARLEKRGWVTRRPDPGDARSTLAALTEAGRAKVEQCLPGYYGVLKRHLFGLVDEEQLRHLNQVTADVMTSLRREG